MTESAQAGCAATAPDHSAARELTPRALLSGILLGALLTPCNVYSGLKIGWSFNMSIIALLLAFGFWRSLERALGSTHWTILESNINQTAASSAASIISGGLVAPIPAFTLLTGESLPPVTLVAWVFCVSFLGVWVAWYLRPVLIVDSPLKFPAGMATLETMRDIFAHGREAAVRILVLLGSAAVSALVKAVPGITSAIAQWSPGPLLKKLTFSLDPSLLLLGFGGIIGLRAGISLLLGALVAWGWLAPDLLARGLVEDATVDGGSLFAPLVEWLIWPGVSMMVSSALTVFIWRVAASLRRPGGHLQRWLPGLTRRGPALAFAVAAALTVLLQVLLFDIRLSMALLAIPLAVLLATVAARVVGETGIPPIGAIGKVSQLSFGVADPGNAVTNLMTANIAGGAAGQSADLLNDFRAGHGIGASPSRQAIAQAFGILTGSIVGVAVYLALIPDPAGQLLSPEWPAPAVATWKAVAEVLSRGLDTLPDTAKLAMAAGACAGLVAGLLECLLPRPAQHLLPSATAMGLAFVIPASMSLTMFAGALLAWVFTRFFSRHAGRFVITVAAGLIAGESVVGVVSALLRMSGI